MMNKGLEVIEAHWLFNALPTPVSYTHLDEAIAKNLKVMDATALTLCRDQKLPICVFSIFKQGALKKVVMGGDEGTMVTP